MKKKRRLQRSDTLWLSAVALLLLLQFWWLPGDPGTPDDSYSSTIEGKRGFFQTLEGLSEAGLLPPVRRETVQLIPNERCTLLILSPDRYPDEHEQQALADFLTSGGSLVFAPNWEQPEVSLSRLSIYTEGKYFYDEDTVVSGGTANTPAVPVPPGTAPNGNLPAEAEEPDDAAGTANGNTSTTPPGVTPVTSMPSTPPADGQKSPGELVDEAMKKTPGLQPPDQALAELEEESEVIPVSDLETESQLVAGSVTWRTRASMQANHYGAKVLVKSSSGTVQAAEWPYSGGQVLLSASSDVFSNRAMLDPRQAELAVRLVQHAHEHHSRSYASDETPIVVSEYLNSSDSYRGTGVLMSPALRSGTLQLITIAMLAGWFGFHRFGPPKRDTSAERRTLTESATAIGNLHFRTNSGGEVVQGYVEYAKSQLQRMFGRTVHLQDTKIIAARSGLDEDEVQSRIATAINLAGARSTSATDAAAAIRDLAEVMERLHGTRAKEK